LTWVSGNSSRYSGTPLDDNSDVVFQILGINDSPSGAVSLDGDPFVDQMLTATPVEIEDSDGLGELQYRWYRDGEQIPSENGSNYTLVTEDMGKDIYVEIFYLDGFGTEEVWNNPEPDT